MGGGGGGLKMIFDEFIAFGTLKVSVFVSNRDSYYNVHEFSKKFSVFVTDAWSQFLMDRFETYKIYEAARKIFFIKADKMADLSLEILATISPM